MAEQDFHLTKKLYILCILKYLKENTDYDNTVTVEELKKALHNEYELNIEQKAIRKNIDTLISLDYPICFKKEIKRSSSLIRTDIYYDQEEESNISSSELYLLIDSILASKYVDSKKANKIANWLVEQGPVSFRRKYINLESTNYGFHTENVSVFYNVDTIMEAIERGKKVKFNYKDYNADGKLEIEKADVVVSPYKTAIHNGIYYVICNVDGSDEIEPFRIDKLFDIELVNEKSISLNKIAPGFNMKTYLESHVYMFPGKEQAVKVRIKRDCFSNLYDFFGNKINVDKRASDDEYAVVTFKANLEGLFYWALQFGANAEVLEPQEVRDRVRDTVIGMTRAYCITNEDKYSNTLSHIEDRRGTLDLLQIDLNGKTRHKKLSNVRRVIIGQNNVNSYDFLNEYENLRVVNVMDPKALDILRLKSKSLFAVGCRKLDYRDPNYDIENLDFIKDCPNIRKFTVENITIKSWDEIYNFDKLEEIIVRKNNFDRIDLSKFSSKPAVTESNNYYIIQFEERIKEHRANAKRPK